jgi:hypothetical protein
MLLDLSLHNDALYSGLDIGRDAGKLNLRTPPQQAMTMMITNLERMQIDPAEVTLTGAMAVWAYLVVLHYLHGRTARIYYKDGMGNLVLVAAHGQ